MIKICPICGKEFEVSSKNKKQIYCSQKCFGIASRTNKSLICDYCGKTFYRPNSQTKMHNKHFCSNRCRYLAERGVNEIFYENDYAYMLLTKDNVTLKTLFDIDDVDKIKQYKWHLHLRKSDQRYDVCANSYTENSKRKYIILPRFLLNAPKGLTVDHINRNTLDNRKMNLKVVSIYKNNQNKSTNTSGCVGVTWDKSRNKWHVTFCKKNLGRFESFEEAVAVRKQAEKDYQSQNL